MLFVRTLIFVCVCYGLSGEGVKDEATSDNILDTVEDLKYVSTFHSHQPNGYVRTTNSTTKFALVDLLPHTSNVHSNKINKVGKDKSATVFFYDRMTF